MSSVRLVDVHKSFSTPDGGRIEALGGVDIAVADGEFVCVIGPTGGGKSTILNLIAGFDFPDHGECLVDDRIVRGPGPDRGMVFQELGVFPWMTVERNLLFALEGARRLRGSQAHEVATGLLNDLGLAGYGSRYPKALSGGMRQRVAIGRVLAMESQVLLMDEPFSALDALTRSLLQEDLVRIWARHRRTVVFVTHNVEEAVYLADRVVVLSPGPAATVVSEKVVRLQRPRDVTGEEFNAIRRELLSSLGSRGGALAGSRSAQANAT